MEQHYDSEWRQKLANLPSHMHEAVSRYVAFGEPIGGFLTAVFSNDLTGAFRAADAENLAAMQKWVSFIYWEVSASCQGSRENVGAWKQQGGLRGEHAT